MPTIPLRLRGRQSPGLRTSQLTTSDDCLIHPSLRLRRPRSPLPPPSASGATSPATGAVTRSSELRIAPAWMTQVDCARLKLSWRSLSQDTSIDQSKCKNIRLISCAPTPSPLPKTSIGLHGNISWLSKSTIISAPNAARFSVSRIECEPRTHPCLRLPDVVIDTRFVPNNAK